MQHIKTHASLFLDSVRECLSSETIVTWTLLREHCTDSATMWCILRPAGSTSPKGLPAGCNQILLTVVVNNKERSVLRPVLYDSIAQYIARAADIVATAHSELDVEEAEVVQQVRGKNIRNRKSNLLALFGILTSRTRCSLAIPNSGKSLDSDRSYNIKFY